MNDKNNDFRKAILFLFEKLKGICGISYFLLNMDRSCGTMTLTHPHFHDDLCPPINQFWLVIIPNNKNIYRRFNPFPHNDTF